MSKMYFILAAVGWIWAMIVAIFLIVRLRNKSQPRGFEVVSGEKNEH